MQVRRMRAEDVPGVERLTGQAFARTPGTRTDAWPRSPQRAAVWQARARHLLEHDAPGCWVADEDGVLLGVALAFRRDLLWALSSYAVHPSFQGKGLGRALLDAALGYSQGCLRGMICGSADPRAARRYRSAGFALHPTMRLSGTVDRSTLPVVDGVRAGSPGDRALADSVDRRSRGAARGPDHAILAAHSRMLVCDLFAGSGYVYCDSESVHALAATNRNVAQRLLWSALAVASPDVFVGHLTAEQDWALDVGMAAGLTVELDGYLCLRHMRPPMPYLPSGPLL